MILTSRGRSLPHRDQWRKKVIKSSHPNAEVEAAVEEKTNLDQEPKQPKVTELSLAKEERRNVTTVGTVSEETAGSPIQTKKIRRIVHDQDPLRRRRIRISRKEIPTRRSLTRTNSSAGMVPNAEDRNAGSNIQKEKKKRKKLVAQTGSNEEKSQSSSRRSLTNIRLTQYLSTLWSANL